MNVVLDTNLVLSAAGWHGTSHRCLAHLALRRYFAFATEPMLEELNRVATRLEEEGRFPKSPWPVVEWYLSEVKIVEPVPLGKRISRDPYDDMIIGAALGARAQIIAAQDNDLLVLRKPFGIEVLSAAAFLRRLEA